MPAPFDRILVLDFETRWNSKDYTLSRMTTESYIRDPRFKAFGASYKWYGEGDDAIWLRPSALRRLFADIDWSRTALMCHNAQFDGAILAWHFGCVAAFYFDTLSMARAVRGLEVGNSAKKLAEAFNLPPKGQAVHSTDGLDELPFEVELELADYCCHDSWLCEQFFDRLRAHFRTGELELIDMTCKMFVNPKLVLDKEMLATAIQEDDQKRAGLLARLQITDKELASNDKFAAVLASMGVEPPTKISPTTKLRTWALSKKDAGFHALISHEREDVALLCEARLKVKSTQERTRAQRFLEIAQRGTLPVPLSYYGAHTGRWTAAKGSFINLQNLKRGSFLRRAIMAPAGYVLVVADLSQIEPRVLAWLARYTAMLDIFRSGGDPYATFGARMFGIPGLTKESHPDLRQSAKSALLGCGYGLGWPSFAGQLMTGFLGAPPVRYDRSFLKQLGVTTEEIGAQMFNEQFRARMDKVPHVCSYDELFVHCVATMHIIGRYREAARKVCDYWQICDSVIRSMVRGDGYEMRGGMTVEKNAIRLPNGMYLRYPGLTASGGANGGDSNGWVYVSPRNPSKPLWGGSLTENIVQALARIIMTDGMRRIARRYQILLTVHDEVVVLVPEAEAAEAEKWTVAQMVVPPAWAPDIPLAAAADSAVRYGDAK